MKRNKKLAEYGLDNPNECVLCGSPILKNHLGAPKLYCDKCIKEKQKEEYKEKSIEMKKKRFLDAIPTYEEEPPDVDTTSGLRF